MLEEVEVDDEVDVDEEVDVEVLVLEEVEVDDEDEVDVEVVEDVEVEVEEVEVEEVEDVDEEVEVEVVVNGANPACSWRALMTRPTTLPSAVAPGPKRTTEFGAQMRALTAAPRLTRTPLRTSRLTSSPKAPPMLVSAPGPNRTAPSMNTVVGPSKSSRAPRLVRTLQKVYSPGRSRITPGLSAAPPMRTVP